VPLSSTELVPFSDEHLDDASALLATRHARHRENEPLLGMGDERRAVEVAWNHGQQVSGAAAVEGDTVVGYVMGRLTSSPIFGRSLWIERAGYAASEPEVLRDLYASAAGSWADAGFERHYVYVPALTEMLEPWYGLAFAQMHVEAIRHCTPRGVPLPQGIDIRRGSISDIETVAIPINYLIAETQALAPSFSAFRESSLAEQRDDWIETLEDSDAVYLIVERDGVAIGHSLLYRPDKALGTPDDAIYLASTAIVPTERSSGLGVGLVDHALSWAQTEGYGSVVTNWRVTNLMASRFWSRLGWRPTFLRLQRVIGTN
jgi:GNAT superfamily N-acetyltransferase